MSKLSLHIQSFEGWVPAFLRVSDAAYIKCVDPPTDNPYPDTKIIGRPFMEDHESNNMIRLGASGADAWFAKWETWIKARPYLFATEGPNEPQLLKHAGFRVNLDLFTERLAHLFTANGLRLVGLNFSVGWPDIGHAPQFARSVAALYHGGHVMGLHEYSARAMWDVKNYHCLRYRSTVRELRNAGVPIPNIFIGECGIDGGVRGEPKQGWRDYASEDEYLEQLAWYDGRLMEDPYVIAATVFTVCDWDWHSFHVDESMGMKIARYAAAHPTPEAPPPPEPPLPEPPTPDAERWRLLFEQLNRIVALVEARV